MSSSSLGCTGAETVQLSTSAMNNSLSLPDDASPSAEEGAATRFASGNRPTNRQSSVPTDAEAPRKRVKSSGSKK